MRALVFARLPQLSVLGISFGLLAVATPSKLRAMPPHTTLGSYRGCRVGRASTSREPVLDVLHLSRLVGVREPVLSHEHVVREANGTAGHEDLGNGETGHREVCKAFEGRMVRKRTVDSYAIEGAKGCRSSNPCMEN
jgi:hypothetical protein